MRKTYLLTLILITSFCGSACANKHYTCTPLKTTGFVYDTSLTTWEFSNTKPGYSYQILQPKPNSAYAVYRFDENKDVQFTPDNIFFTCGPYSPEKGNLLLCDTLGGTFNYDINTGRYLIHYWLAYYGTGPGTDVADDHPTNKPYLEIGTCSEKQ